MPEAISQACGGDVVTIDSACVGVDRHGAARRGEGPGAGGDPGCRVHSRGGPTTRIRVPVDAEARPVRLKPAPRRAGDAPSGTGFVSGLGRRLTSPQPQTGGDERNGGEDIARGLLAARRELSEALEAVEEALDDIPPPVQRRIPRPLRLAVALRGDMAAVAARGDQVQNRPRVASTIRDHVAGRGMGGRKRFDRRLVRRLPRAERDRHRRSPRIDHRVDPGAQSATRTTDGVIFAPFSPPRHVGGLG